MREASGIPTPPNINSLFTISSVHGYVWRPILSAWQLNRLTPSLASCSSDRLSQLAFSRATTLDRIRAMQSR